MSPSQPLPEPVAQGAPDEFPVEELQAHRGRWVAFSPDGRRLVAGAASLAALEVLVRAAGEDPEEVLLEHLPVGAFVAAGMELS